MITGQFIPVELACQSERPLEPGASQADSPTLILIRSLKTGAPVELHSALIPIPFSLWELQLTSMLAL
eukprot:1159147-Pelagomonas_calceolata.AAC.6